MGMVLTGCSTEPETETEPEPERPAAATKAAAEKTGEKAGEKAGEKTAEPPKPAAEKGGTVGAAGSACVLPVSFDLAADWKPEAVKADTGGEFGGLFTQGTVTLACEIDAKPAGNIGYIRVWTGGKSGEDVRKALEAFVADEAKSRKQEVYKEIKAGDLAVTEVTYLNTGELLDAPKNERAFAVTTGRGVVVVHLGGLDSEEHKQMLPAYELAKKSVRTT
ncbi:lipoprotein [Streptomyces sp. NPDC052236]|uniref:lipoprotein n=1 Tax=Streptomyces sp. NPDC052236 TaxID=3365686 RepID=UPI0037CEEA0C